MNKPQETPSRQAAVSSGDRGHPRMRGKQALLPNPQVLPSFNDFDSKTYRPQLCKEQLLRFH